MTKKQTRRKAPGQKRYTKEEREEILQFIDDHNDKHAVGGIIEARRKFGVTPPTIKAWTERRTRHTPKGPAPQGSIFELMEAQAHRIANLETLLGVGK